MQNYGTGWVDRWMDGWDGGWMVEPGKGLLTAIKKIWEMALQFICIVSHFFTL